MAQGVDLALEVAAGTSHHGRASYERSLSPAQYAFVSYGPSTTSAAWRARATISSAAPHPQLQRSHAYLRRAKKAALASR